MAGPTDNVAVTRYALPFDRHSHVFWSCVAIMGLLSRPANFVPGSWVYNHVFSSARFPAQLYDFLVQYRLSILYGLLGVHLAEAVVFGSRKLPAHGLTPRSSVWWLWVGSMMIEGFGAGVRFNEVVKQEAAKRK